MLSLSPRLDLFVFKFPKDFLPKEIEEKYIQSAPQYEEDIKKIYEHEVSNINALIEENAIDVIKECLLPLTRVLTPNIPEAQVLWGNEIKEKEDMTKAAREISQLFGTAVLLKGGHSLNDACDLLYRNGEYKWFEGRRIDNPNTHGTGCTLSSAIASNLAKGFDLAESIKKAKEYISAVLSAGLDLGKGSGPLKHNFFIRIFLVIFIKFIYHIIHSVGRSCAVPINMA